MDSELSKTQVSNTAWNSTQYSTGLWRDHLNKSFYRTEHNGDQFNLNNKLNPEVQKKKHNVRITQISEYSNAKYCNTVFLNPKFSSC